MVVDPSKPFDPLVECGVLTAAQADQLEYRGVRTREDLVQRTQSGTRRRALSLETGISEDSLLAAGVVAHAINSLPQDNQEGIRLVASMEFSAPESARGMIAFCMNGSIAQEQATILELLVEFAQESTDESIARSDVFKTSRIVGGYAALVLIGLVVSAIDLRSSLFPGAAPNAAQAALDVLFRERALTTLTSTALVLLSALGFVTLQNFGSDAVSIVEKRLGRRQLPPADFLRLAQAGSMASPKTPEV